MNFKVFLGSFMIIMLAELFDKTQLAIFSLGLKEKSKLSVFLGAMCAFFIATLVALLLGQFFAKYIDAKTIRYVSAFVFFAAGTLILLGKL